MSAITNHHSLSQTQRRIVQATFALLLIITSVGIALADNDHGGGNQHGGHPNNGHHRGPPHGGDRDWSEHEGRSRRYRSQPYFEPEPSDVYAPPLVYYPPDYQPPGINFIIPLHIR